MKLEKFRDMTVGGWMGLVETEAGFRDWLTQSKRYKFLQNVMKKQKAFFQLISKLWIEQKRMKLWHLVTLKIASIVIKYILKSNIWSNTLNLCMSVLIC